MKILEELFYGNLDESTRKMGEYLKNKRKENASNLFSTHPGIEERIEALENLK